jgi:broad specificity phosphatase PhoE
VLSHDHAGIWRSRPEDFVIDGRQPVHEVFAQAKEAWMDIILHPSDVTLVISHKSVLRAMFCVAMGLGPPAFRALEVHNAGVSIFWVNRNAEALLQNMNLTTHLAVPLRY